jgi:MFS transporter, PHS family, inorganic phosphate transporter
MAAVFLMQPLGQLAVSAMSLLTLMIFDKSPGLATERDRAVDILTVDKIWRLVIIVNTVPAFITFLVRFTSPESPRYILEVKNTHSPHWNSYEAQSTTAIDADRNEVEDTLPRFEVGISEKVPTDGSNKRTLDGLEMIHLQHEPKLKQLSYDGIKEYFWARGNWRRLAGTSMCCFLFGIVYSGLDISNPRILAQIWTPSPLANSGNSFSGQVDPAYSNSAIYEALMQDSIHMIIAISAGNLLGSIILVAIIDYVPRKKMLAWSFISLAIWFAIAGGCFFNASSPVDLQPLKVMFYITCQILCNLGKFLFTSSYASTDISVMIGPNALLFIVSYIQFHSS